MLAQGELDADRVALVFWRKGQNAAHRAAPTEVACVRLAFVDDPMDGARARRWVIGAWLVGLGSLGAAWTWFH